MHTTGRARSFHGGRATDIDWPGMLAPALLHMTDDAKMRATLLERGVPAWLARWCTQRLQAQFAGAVAGAWSPLLIALSVLLALAEAQPSAIANDPAVVTALAQMAGAFDASVFQGTSLSCTSLSCVRSGSASPV